MPSTSDNQTWLVTGANRGIGLEFVRQLRASGRRVIGAARRPSAAPELCSLADRVVELDTAEDDSIAALPSRLGDEPIDVLINNAGVGGEGKTLDSLTSAELASVFRVNSIGPMLVARAVVAGLRRGRRRLIVNISSILGSIEAHQGGSYAYRASKAALNMMTVGLAKELKPEGFCCVTVHPGWVRTDMGGPNAPLAAPDAVASMLRVFEGLAVQDSGRFLNYDGTGLPW